MYWYVPCTDLYILVCTEYLHVYTMLYLSESCFTGFRGARRDTNTRVPDVEQPPVDQENDSDDSVNNDGRGHGAVGC